MVTFHPHTTHKMKHLDRGVFGPFNTYYNTKVNVWMFQPENTGNPATIYNVEEAVGKAFSLAFSPSNITHGFQVSGLHPLNEDIFQNNEFLPSILTDGLICTLTSEDIPENQIMPMKDNSNKCRPSIVIGVTNRSPPFFYFRPDEH